jgi:glycosyltransferase involved in cell wall biosynthesis
MNILLANWTWYSSGGDWTYVDMLQKVYKNHDNAIIPFSMHDERNNKTPFQKYFIHHVDYREMMKEKTIRNGIDVLRKSIYSTEAKNNLELLIKEHKIDFAHLNNIHHYLTPSIIPVLKRYMIPIIWTLHDYSLLCPNTTFISQGKVCERCKTSKYYNCVLHRCKKGSLLASTVAAMGSYVQQFLKISKYVDYFIAPSEFLYNKCLEYGIDEKRITCIYNGYDQTTLNIADDEKVLDEPYVIYVGNLIRVKGIDTLIEAVIKLSIKLVIIGDGEHAGEMKEKRDRLGAKNIIFLGRKEKSKVLKWITAAKVVIIPSEWYENLSYSIVEAQLLAKPVVVSRIGGNGELVLDEITGLLFAPGNVGELREKILYLLANQEKAQSLGIRAKERTTKMTNIESFYINIKEILHKLNLS